MDGQPEHFCFVDVEYGRQVTRQKRNRVGREMSSCRGFCCFTLGSFLSVKQYNSTDKMQSRVRQGLAGVEYQFDKTRQLDKMIKAIEACHMSHVIKERNMW